MNEVITDCIKYVVNVGIVAGCLLALGILAVRKNRPKVTRRRPMTLGEALLAKHRKGISLIEVLMSIFIISIGILGVLSVVYLGGHQTQRGLDADRAAAAGQAALRDFKVRAMDCPATWRTTAGGLLAVNPSSVAASTPLIPFEDGTPQKYCLDPRGVSAGVTQPFPAGGSQAMQRITLGGFIYAPDPNIPTLPDPTKLRVGIMPRSVADEVFSCQDDLHFTVIENNPTAAPLQTMEGTNEKRFAGRDLSWFATIVRESTAGTHYTLSVAVVRSRNAPAAAGEAEVGVTMTGGIGGGEAVLTGTATTGPFIKELGQGSWLMLSHAERADWYRVIALSEYNPTTFARDVTLAGRDWDTAGAYAAPKAAIMPAVIGVYQRTISLKHLRPY